MMRKISNSEVATFLYCKRKYWYEYMMDLEPKVLSGPISKGVLIHSILEQYYLAKMDNESEDECRRQAYTPLVEAVGQPDADLAELGKIRSLSDAYFDKYESDDNKYDVIAVETKLSIPLIEDQFSLAGTIDAIFQDKEDGSIIPVDHKSSYNFWTDDQLTISGQFVKYMYATRARGYDVKKFMVNQIRTRDMKPGNELFRRSWVIPSEKRIRAVMAQHLMIGAEIMEFRRRNEKADAVPIFDKYNCSNCPFLQLCDSDTEGVPTEYMIEQNYAKRESYGYQGNEGT